jgi:hypothetical protein
VWEPSLEERFKAGIVWLILNGQAEQAVALLARYCGVNEPKVEVGLPKGRKKRAIGCYSAKNKTITVMNSDTLKDPFVILHEFYHHLRTTSDAKHKGTEKYANDFARRFIHAYKSTVDRDIGNN